MCFFFESSQQSGVGLKKEKQAALLAFSKLLLFYLQLHSSNFKIVSRYMVFRDSPPEADSSIGEHTNREKPEGVCPCGEQSRTTGTDPHGF